MCQHLGIDAGNACTTRWEKQKCAKGEAARNRAKRIGDAAELTRLKTSTNIDTAKPVEQRVAEESDLTGELLTKYQSLSARANYLAQDRVDIQFSVKELMRKMSKPNNNDYQALKRVARYLLGAPRLVLEFPWQRRSDEIKVHVDSDFAGCQTTRKSTSGETVTWGSSTLKTWSKTQSVIDSTFHRRGGARSNCQRIDGGSGYKVLAS